MASMLAVQRATAWAAGAFVVLFAVGFIIVNDPVTAEHSASDLIGTAGDRSLLEDLATTTIFAAAAVSGGSGDNNGAFVYRLRKRRQQQQQQPHALNGVRDASRHHPRRREAADVEQVKRERPAAAATGAVSGENSVNKPENSNGDVRHDSERHDLAKALDRFRMLAAAGASNARANGNGATGGGSQSVGGVQPAAASLPLSLSSKTVASAGPSAYASSLHNTPPTFVSRRDWVVDEDHRIGDRVLLVTTADADGDPIRFSLAPAAFRDGSHLFRVDPITGEVFLRRSLAGLGGRDFYVFVCADDGHHQAKMEVSVRVVRRRRRQPLWQPASPSPPPPLIVADDDVDPSSDGGSNNRTNDSDGADEIAEARRRKYDLDAAPSRPSPADLPPPPVLPPGAAAPASPARGGGGRPLPDDHNGDDGGESNGLPLTSPRGVLLVAAVAITLACAAGVPLALVGMQLVRTRRAALLSGFGSSTESSTAAAVDKQKAHTRNGFFGKDSKKAVNKGIALSKMPSQPSWVIALEKREPALKSAEFFSTLTDDKWEFPRHHLRFLHMLGEGCFGQVWKCEAMRSAASTGGQRESGDNVGNGTSSMIVAVKTLKDNATEKEKKDLLGELAIMKLLDPHPNIVTLLGCCTGKDPLFVIMEYVRHGKLQTFLRDRRPPETFGERKPPELADEPPLTSTELTRFGYQVAKGMEYLVSKSIIHRDLAARNVLVTETRQCKVADFGFARDVISSHIYERKSEGRLPVRWMAPESLYDNRFTPKTDVWAFGVLLWEIVTLGSTPYPGMSGSEVMRMLRDGYRLEKPEHCKRELYNIMTYCWDADPARRPSFTELTHMLEKLTAGENDYIELERFPEHAYYNVCHDLPGEKL